MFICGGFSETTLALQMTAVVIALLLSWTAVGNRSLRHPGEVRLPIRLRHPGEVRLPIRLRHPGEVRLPIRLSRILVVSFMATAASVLVVCVAPGNAIRQAGLGPPAMAAAAIAKAIWYAALWPERFLVLKAPTAVSVFAAGWLVARLNPSSNVGVAVFQRRIIMCLLAAAALLTMSFLPTAYALNGFPPSRVLIVPQYVLVLAVLACGCSCAALACVTRPGSRTLRSFELLLFTLLIAAPLWSVYGTFQSHADAARYAMLWDRRDRRLRAAAQAGQLDVVLDPLPEHLAIPGVASGSPAEDALIARFYGFRSVREDRVHQRAVVFGAQKWSSILAAPETMLAVSRRILSRILK
jgi:hypothetical protein